MDIHSEISGKTNHQPIIFVHGAGGSSATWMMQLRGLKDNFKIIAVDLNGHGKTADRMEKDVTQSYLSDIDTIIRRYDQPILAGHSMGGMLTQLYALSQPELIRGIVLVGTGARLKVMPAIFEMIENDFDGYIDAAGEFMFHKGASQELVAASKIEMRKCKPEIISRDFAACDIFDIMDDVSKITIPTLIMVGKDDMMTPVKYSEYLHKEIQNSSLEIIENAGHAVMLEQAAILNRTIKDWAQRL